MNTLDVAVWGSTGYAGQELMGILKGHPAIGEIDTPGHDLPVNLGDIDVAFLALPHGDSALVAKHLGETVSTIIDLSGDFRFQTAEEYEAWYHQKHPAPELLPAPYALLELNRNQLRNSKLISVPGCYPTATLLGALPLIKKGLVKPETTVLVDAISGVSGMGKRQKKKADEIIASGDVMPYSPGRIHRHVGEIEQFLDGRQVYFSPSVGPFFRGMLAKTTLELEEGVDSVSVDEVLHDAYREEPFVKILGASEVPRIRDTVGTDMCHIGAVVVGNNAQLISSLDNLREGAATQAVRGFNVALGLPEDSGLLR